jgi:hypothetical protein
LFLRLGETFSLFTAVNSEFQPMEKVMAHLSINETTSSSKPSEHAGGKKETKLGIEVKKKENFSEWYTQVIIRSEMLDYYDISGCYIIRPWSFGIWKRIQRKSFTF